MFSINSSKIIGLKLPLYLQRLPIDSIIIRYKQDNRIPHTGRPVTVNPIHATDTYMSGVQSQPIFHIPDEISGMRDEIDRFTHRTSRILNKMSGHNAIYYKFIYQNLSFLTCLPEILSCV